MESAVSCATCGVENDSAAAAHNRTGRLGQLKISTCTHARTMITQPRSNPDTTPKATADMRLRFESCMLRGSSRPAEGFFMAQASCVILKANIQRSKQGGIAIYRGPTCCADVLQMSYQRLGSWDKYCMVNTWGASWPRRIEHANTRMYTGRLTGQIN